MCRKEWQESMVEMAHREKVTVKGTCVGHDAIRHSDWFGISSQTVSSPPPPSHLIGTQHWWVFAIFERTRETGNPTRVSAFTIERRVEGTDGFPMLRWGYPRFTEQATKFPVQFRYTIRSLVPITYRVRWNAFTSAQVIGKRQAKCEWTIRMYAHFALFQRPLSRKHWGKSIDLMIITYTLYFIWNCALVIS